MKSKLILFIKNNQIISISILFIFLALSISSIKIFNPNTDTVYVKVKVSQGLWWANSRRPNIWYVQSLKKGDVEYDTLLKPSATIEKVTYYPYPSEDIESQYDVYLDVKLKADKNNKQYKYNRSPITTGSPIDLEFSSTLVTGTVIKFDTKPFNPILEEKIVYLQKKGSYPAEYDEIEIGDTFFDGENIAFEILDKSFRNTSYITSDLYGNYTADRYINAKFITLKTKMLLQKTNLGYIYGEETAINPGAGLYIETPKHSYANYFVSKVEDIN